MTTQANSPLKLGSPVSRGWRGTSAVETLRLRRRRVNNDVVTQETLVSIAVGLALAAAAGFRVFVPLLALSLGTRFGWLDLAPSFEWIGSSAATMALATATVVEVAAYYVPFLDNLLDTIASPVAVLAGVVASASLLTDLPPWLQYSIAIIGGGGTAGVVQAGTTLLRLKSSALTAGLANSAIASLELGSALLLVLFAIVLPLLALLLVVLVLVFAARRLIRSRRRSTAGA
jgi:hypothetical protein